MRTIIASLSLLAVASVAQAAEPYMSGTPLSPTVLVAGQPSLQELQAAQKAGVKLVINLRPPSEPSGLGDEAAVVQKLGMTYVNIPVAGPAGITLENAKKLRAALAGAKDQQVLLHCASGNRVGALLALEAFFLDGKTVEEAMATGKAARLTGLAGYVQGQLEAALKTCKRTSDRACRA
jgi:uncharacterized protein (TIGR01244 family)